MRWGTVVVMDGGGGGGLTMSCSTGAAIDSVIRRRVGYCCVIARVRSAARA